MKHPQVSFLVVPFWVRVFVFIAACVLMWVTDGWEISSVFPVYLSARTLRVLSERYGNVQLNPLIMGTGRSTNFPGKTWIERSTCGARRGRLEEIRYLFEHPWLLVWKFCFFLLLPPLRGISREVGKLVVDSSWIDVNFTSRELQSVWCAVPVVWLADQFSWFQLVAAVGLINGEMLKLENVETEL